jgi:hypothetical protein
VTNRHILVYTLDLETEERPAVELLGIGIGRHVWQMSAMHSRWRGTEHYPCVDVNLVSTELT